MNWIGAKQHPTQFASNKNTPGKSSSEIVERSSDYFKAGTKIKACPLFGKEPDEPTPTD
jgi:hypothetical protein